MAKEIVSPIIYRQGYGYHNPYIGEQLTRTPRQDFLVTWGKKAKGIWDTKKLPKTKSFWRQKAKAKASGSNNIIEVKGFEDLALGATNISSNAPAERNIWGALTSFIAYGAESGSKAILKTEEKKLTQAKTKLAIAQQSIEDKEISLSKSIFDKLPYILGIGGSALLITMLIIRSKQK